MTVRKRASTTTSLARASVCILAITIGFGLSAFAQIDSSADAERHPQRIVSPAGSARITSGASSIFDAAYYHLRIGIDFATERINGTARVSGHFITATQDLRLDLVSDLEVATVRDAVTGDLDFTHVDNVLAIDLGRIVTAGTLVDLEIEYEGQPQTTGFGAFSFSTVDGRPAAWTLSEPYGARAWWPGKDHPSDKADSARVTVTVPAGLRVGSNGLLAAVTEDGDEVTYDWVVRYPIAPYLLSLAAGPYAAFSQTYVRPDSLATRLGPFTLPILHYKYTSKGEAALPAGWAEVLDAMAVFEWWFGPYPFPEEKYGHAQFGWSGGMEHQTMTSMGGTSVGLVTHELAHQWFGNAVTTQTWPHLWLNEGFASYAEILYWEAMRERYGGMAESTLRVDQQRARSARGTLVVEDTLDVQNLFSGGRVYGKGSAVLHMLRNVIGDEAFRATLQAYLNDPDLAYGTAVTADFQRVAEDVSGRDLDTFFRQWVTEGTGHPIYDVTFSHRPVAAGGYDVELGVRQTQTAPESNVEVFVMPVTVAIATASGEQRFVIENNQRLQVFGFHVEEPPLDVQFDPDRVILSNEPFAIDLGPLPAGFELSFRLAPNPTTGPIRLSGRTPSTDAARVVVMDVLGRHVRTLWEGTAIVGSFQLDAHLTGLAQGTYFVSLQQGEMVLTRPVALLR